MKLYHVLPQNREKFYKSRNFKPHVCHYGFLNLNIMLGFITTPVNHLYAKFQINPVCPKEVIGKNVNIILIFGPKIGFLGPKSAILDLKF